MANRTPNQTLVALGVLGAGALLLTVLTVQADARLICTNHAGVPFFPSRWDPGTRCWVSCGPVIPGFPEPDPFCP